MDFFDRHKALILTVLVCSILILVLINFRLQNYKNEGEEMLVNLDQFMKEEPEPEPEKEEKPEETEEPEPEQVETHRAFNENQEARKENFNRQLEEILEKNAAEREETSEEESESGEYSVPKKQKKEQQKASQGNDASETTANQKGGIRNSSISFSLRGRSAIDIPNPVYTCDIPGKVVINIEVNSEGTVIDTDYNKASSTSTNECLIEQALQYAEGARFSPLPGRDKQPGTITYHFKP